MNDNSVCALLVLGPAHGTQIMLPSAVPVYLVPGQRELTALVNVRDMGMSLDHLPVHQYRRTTECVMPGNRGHFIYEYDGLTRT